MTHIDKQIEAHIQKFAAELNDLLRHAAIKAVGDALGASPAHVAAPAARVAAPKATKATKAKATGARKSTKSKARGRKGIRRSPEELQKQQDDLLDYIAANPGEPMEKIAKVLGVTSGEMNRPISKLIKAGRVRRQGERRASRYFVGRKGAKRKR